MTDTFKSTVVAMARLFADNKGRLSLDTFMDIFGGLDSEELLEVLDILDEEGVYVNQEADEKYPIISFEDKKEAFASTGIARTSEKSEYTLEQVCTLFLCVKIKVA